MRSRSRNRRATAACAAAALWACGGPAEPLRPNVLLISVDTLRADHLASYGYERDTAPSLTALAGQGAQFERSFAHSPSTPPSHASIFTSRLPFEHGVFTYQHGLREDELTLAEVLQGHGYATFAVVGSRRFHERSGFAQGFASYQPVFELDKNERGARATDLVLEKALAAGSTPWFGFVHYFDPHAPYAPPEPYRTMWHPGHEDVAHEATTRYLQDHAPIDVEVPAEVLEFLRGAYDGGISFADSHLQRLFDGLAGGERPTLIVVTSDHGEEFKEHGHLGHSLYLHEELVRVPLLMAWPGVIPSGLRIDDPVHGADLFPTILELAGLPVPDGLAGRSFAARLRGEAGPLEQRFQGDGHRDVVFYQQNQANWGIAATLESGRFKLVKERTHSDYQLYRLDDDPDADRDVASEFPAERDSLIALAERLGVWSASGRADELELEPELEAEIRAMGYAGEAGD